MISRFLLLFLFSSVFAGKDYFVIINEKIVDAFCFRGTYMGALVRGYTSVGMVDPNLKSNLEKLGEAGIYNLVYMTPCPKCGNPLKQILDLKKIVDDRGKRYMIDVTHPGIWFSDIQKNREFMLNITTEIVRHCPEVGIITNMEMYSKIFGKDFLIPMSYLTLVRPDNKDECLPIKPFGAFDRTIAKIYKLNQEVCKMTLDLIYVCYGK